MQTLASWKNQQYIWIWAFFLANLLVTVYYYALVFLVYYSIANVGW